MTTARCSHGYELGDPDDGFVGMHRETQTIGGGENLQIVGRWEDCDDFDLIEDEDGAPIPGPLQRQGPAYQIIRDFMEAYPSVQSSSHHVRRTVIDSLAIKLAPYTKLEVDDEA